MCVGLVLCASMAFAQGATLRAEAPVVVVGDRWKYEQHDRRSGRRQSVLLRTITFVNASRVEGTEDGNRFVWTRELNLVKSATVAVSGVPRHLNFPMEVGKRWAYEFVHTSKQAPNEVIWRFDARVVAYEKVNVPAGEFDAFRIEYSGRWTDTVSGRSGLRSAINWFAPAARNIVKIELEDGSDTWVRQLVELRLQP